MSNKIPALTRAKERTHREKLLAKLEKIQGLQALLEMWESHPCTDSDYIRELRRRLHSAQTQYLNMRP